MNWLHIHRPKLFSETEYVILEPSVRRQEWQQETLKSFPNVRWFTGFEGLKRKTQNAKLHGVLFSNELLDAFPVRRLGWDAREKKWFEWGISFDGEKFNWTRISAPHSALCTPQLDLPTSISHLPSAFLSVLPDGYIIEHSPGAENWWRAAAGILSCGKLLAIDYGFTAEEQFSPARLNGTLRAYHRHHVTDDMLAHPGEQDLTAHVNFPAIQQAGEETGLATEIYCTQPQFLTRILQKAVTKNFFASLDAKYVRQFQTLTHPEHLGRAFRVLVQSRPQ